MKLMGTGKLHALLAARNGTLAGAVSSLHAELAAAEWEDENDAAATYPQAVVAGNRIQIELPDDHCAVIAVNYGARAVLVEFAGPSDEHTPLKRARGRKHS